MAYFTEDSLYAGFQKTIMSEVSFAKSFLATLDKRPIKLPGDQAGDPRKYPNTSPVSLMNKEQQSIKAIVPSI